MHIKRVHKSDKNSHLRNLPALVVAAQNCDPVTVADLQRDEEADRFYAMVAWKRRRHVTTSMRKTYGRRGSKGRAPNSNIQGDQARTQAVLLLAPRPQGCRCIDGYAAATNWGGCQ